MKRISESNNKTRGNEMSIKEKIDKYSIINAIKLFIPFARKKYLSNLSDYYGCPNDVLWTLQQMCEKYPILSKPLKTEIARLQSAVEYYSAPYYEELEEYGCRTCEWGNGEGGCTIPGYCPQKS